MPENRAVWRLWIDCNNQWRVGPLGPVGLDWPAVDWVAERQDPPLDVDAGVFRRLKHLEQFELNRMARRNDAGNSDNY
jgi:hypothetical protein